MDYSVIASRYHSPAAAAEQIKNAIFSKFGYTVNIGISDRKVLAKMASDFKKPDLVHTLYSYEIKEKMWSLPVSSLFMCGHSSVTALRKLEILTIGDLAQTDKSIISAHLKSHGSLLWEYANGMDESEVITKKADAKGIGNSMTLTEDALNNETAFRVLLQLSESVAGRLRRSSQLAGMISLEIKYNTFLSVSHQTTLSAPVSTTDAIYHTACGLFNEIWDGTPIRLLGIRTSKLISRNEPVQMSLFDMPRQTSAPPSSEQPIISMEKQQKLEHALDAIRNKYGAGSIVRGSLLHTEKEE